VAADEAESIADEAAIIDEVAAADASAEGGVTIVVVDAGAGVVVVVVVSSFLLQAANEMAAASVTISNAVFIFLLDLGSDNYRKLWEPSHEEPHRSKTRKAEAFQCLTLDYRRLKGVP